MAFHFGGRALFIEHEMPTEVSFSHEPRGAESMGLTAMHAVLFTVLVTLSTAPPAGQKADERLRRGEGQAARLEYESSFHTLQNLVADLSDDDPLMVRARLSAGCVAIVLGRTPEARLHFAWVLERDPAAQLVGPDADSPKIESFFEEVRDEVRERDERTRAAHGRNQFFGLGTMTAPDVHNALWLGVVAATTASAVSAIAGTSLALYHDGVAGDLGQGTIARRQAQESGRLWLGVGLSSLALGGAGLAGTWLLAPEAE